MENQHDNPSANNRFPNTAPLFFKY